MSAPVDAAVRLHGLSARLAPGRRGTDLELVGEVELPAGASVDGLSLFFTARDAAGRLLAVEESRLGAELAVQARLPFRESTRMPPRLAEDLDCIEAWAVATIDEVALEWTVPAEALGEARAGSLSSWRGAGCSVVRGLVESDGDVRITVHGRCPLVPGGAYDRSGTVQLTVVDRADGVLFHDETSFPTLGGAVGAVPFSERLRPHVDQLVGAAAFQFRLLTRRAVASERVVVAGAAVEREEG